MIALVMSAVLAVSGPVPSQVQGGPCARVHVPMAEQQVVSCLDELTTAGTVTSGHTVQADWAGLTHAALPQPSGVPGVQIDGYFPDDSASNTNHGWNHDSQFVIRLPKKWNGGLVVTGSPGTRRQYANDRAIADYVLSKGYAFAATDKGNTGLTFYKDGKKPGDALAEWHRRVTQLTIAAKVVVTQHYGRFPKRTIAAGISNGGYLVRWQLENNPLLFDGGVDWEGTLWRADGPNLFTFLPAAMRDQPLSAGFPAASDFLWPYHKQVYWDLTQRTYREEFDPGFDGDLDAGIPYCASGTPHCDADYDYASRPREVKDAVNRISLTGRIGKPLVTLHGTLDTLLPISQSSDMYAEMIRAADRSKLHSYHRIEGGNHVDGLVDTFPGRLTPMGPAFRSAFNELEHRLR